MFILGLPFIQILYGLGASIGLVMFVIGWGCFVSLSSTATEGEMKVLGILPLIGLVVFIGCVILAADEISSADARADAIAAKQRSQYEHEQRDRAGEALRRTIAAEQKIYTSTGRYSDSIPTLVAVEPALNQVTIDSVIPTKKLELADGGRTVLAEYWFGDGGTFDVSMKDGDVVVTGCRAPTWMGCSGGRWDRSRDSGQGSNDAFSPVQRLLMGR